MMDRKFNAGSGCMAWRLTEDEIPDLYAIITIHDDQSVPVEGEPLVIGVYQDDVSDPLLWQQFDTTKALEDWYEENVGHRMDHESWASKVQLVAGAMLFYFR
jgi:hypothetical protein